MQTSQQINHGPVEMIILESYELAERGQLEEALAHLAQTKSKDDRIRNARGVCLMRLGRYDDAISLFRSLVMELGTPNLRQGIPTIFATNFALALLLSGRWSGCQEALGDIKDRHHSSVIHTKSIFDQWLSKLGWLEWLNWKLGSDPSMVVKLDFPPGEFFDPMSSSTDERRRGLAHHVRYRDHYVHAQRA